MTSDYNAHLMEDSIENLNLDILFDEAPESSKRVRNSFSPENHFCVSRCSTFSILNFDSDDSDDGRENQLDNFPIGSSLSNRISDLLHQKLLVDVHFIVGDDSHRFSAHKLILVAASPVFKALFAGDLAPPSHPIPEIRVSDVSSIGFQILLDYAYSDDDYMLDLTPESAVLTLYAAKKYMIDGLFNRCANYLIRSLSVESVLMVLAHSILVDEKKLTEVCLRLIESHTDEVISTEEWTSAELPALLAILHRDGLTCREVTLLQGLVKWGQAEKERLHLSRDIKEILGADILSAIRFGAMSLTELQKVVQPMNILSDNDLLKAVFESSNGKVQGRVFTGALPELDLMLLYSVPHLSKTCEQIIIGGGSCRNSRQCRCQPVGLNPRKNVALSGGFEVFSNTKLVLAGLQLFGAPGNPNMKVCLQVECLTSNQTILDIRRNQLQASRSRRLICTHDLYFTHPVVLHPGGWYRIHSTMDGPIPAYMCDQPTGSVSSNGLSIRFRKPKYNLQVPYASFISGIYYAALPIPKKVYCHNSSGYCSQDASP